jgi:hypothetical protein
MLHVAIKRGLEAVAVKTWRYSKHQGIVHGTVLKDFRTEYAKSGKSTCKSCLSKIDEVRIRSDLIQNIQFLLVYNLFDNMSFTLVSKMLEVGPVSSRIHD